MSVYKCNVGINGDICKIILWNNIFFKDSKRQDSYSGQLLGLLLKNYVTLYQLIPIFNNVSNINKLSF